MITKFKQTEIGEIPENWRLDKLKNVSNVYDSLHSTPRYSNCGVPMVRVTDIKPGFLNLNNTLTVDSSVYQAFTKKYLPRKGDIVVSRVGSYGNFSFVNLNHKFCLGQNTAIIHPLIDNRFLYYFLSSNLCKQQVDSLVVGSTQKTLSLEHIRNLSIAIPSLEEQKQIASILSSLDAKIDLNQKSVKNLDEIGQSLFKRWFVDFEFPNEKGEPYKSSGGKMIGSELGEIPSEWRVDTLNALLLSCVGGDWGKENEENKFNIKVQCIRGADIPELKVGNRGKPPRRYVKSNIEKILINGDIVIEISGGSPTQSTGRSVLITDSLLNRFNNQLVCSNFCRVLRFKEKLLSAYFSNYLNLVYSSDDLFQYENGTTGIKNLDINSFTKNYKFILPTQDILTEFNNIFEALISRIQSYGFESEKLSEAKNSLLPKLLSGKIGV